MMDKRLRATGGCLPGSRPVTHTLFRKKMENRTVSVRDQSEVGPGWSSRSPALAVASKPLSYLIKALCHGP